MTDSLCRIISRILGSFGGLDAKKGEVKDANIQLFLQVIACVLSTTPYIGSRDYGSYFLPRAHPWRIAVVFDLPAATNAPNEPIARCLERDGVVLLWARWFSLNSSTEYLYELESKPSAVRFRALWGRKDICRRQVYCPEQEPDQYDVCGANFGLDETGR